MNNQKGEAVLGILGFIAIVGLFVAYVSGHPLTPKPENACPVAVIEVTQPGE